MMCRWCGRELDLPLGDECSRCQRSLNVRRLTLTPVKVIYPVELLALYEGCTLALDAYEPRATRIEWGPASNSRRVREDVEMFFRHADRLEIASLKWEGRER